MAMIFSYNLPKICKVTFPPNSLLARLGGDEFIVVCEEIESFQTLELYGLALKKALDTSYTLYDLALKNSASVGSALFPIDAENLDELIHIADERMYKDKRIDHLLKN